MIYNNCVNLKVKSVTGSKKRDILMFVTFC